MAAHEKMAKAYDELCEKGTLNGLSGDDILGAADELIEALKRHTTATIQNSESKVVD